MLPTPSEVARAYHLRTKHYPQRPARSLGYLDWENQPDPFRRFIGAPTVRLPLPAPSTTATHAQIAQGTSLPRVPCTLASISRMLRLCLGLTAWKQVGESRWSLRANPSSGNLHPTEGYLVLPPLDGMPAGVYHYAPHDHLLEQRCVLDSSQAERLRACLPAGGFLVGITSILWREAWKYGERAFRYCQHDVGHAIGTVAYAAACLGWRALPLGGLDDDGLAAVLGTDRQVDFENVDEWEREHADLLLAIVPASRGADDALDWSAERAQALVEILAAGHWRGSANELSSDHYPWDVIPVVAEATKRMQPATCAAAWAYPHSLPQRYLPQPLSLESKLETLILQRRSAVAMNPRVSLSLAGFARILDATLARADLAPWCAWEEPAHAHLLLFVHRVDDLEPGLYFLVRDPGQKDDIAAALSSEMQMEEVAALPAEFAHLPLYKLKSGRCASAAASVSCQQEIAGTGAFSLGMITRLASVVDRDASTYRRLYWECGLIGQALYLESEAEGLRGTGIGCFFDDSVHALIGLSGEEWQSLYHFTLGAPVDDDRIQTRPAYEHLRRTGAQDSVSD